MHTHECPYCRAVSWRHSDTLPVYCGSCKLPDSPSHRLSYQREIRRSAVGRFLFNKGFTGPTNPTGFQLSCQLAVCCILGGRPCHPAPGNPLRMSLPAYLFPVAEGNSTGRDTPTCIVRILCALHVYNKN